MYVPVNKHCLMCCSRSTYISNCANSVSYYNVHKLNGVQTHSSPSSVRRAAAESRLNYLVCVLGLSSSSANWTGKSPEWREAVQVSESREGNKPQLPEVYTTSRDESMDERRQWATWTELPHHTEVGGGGVRKINLFTSLHKPKHSEHLKDLDISR